MPGKKRKTLKKFLHIIQLRVPVYVQVSAKLFLPLIGWLAETDLTFLKVLRFSFPVPLEKNFEPDLRASLLAHRR